MEVLAAFRFAQCALRAREALLCDVDEVVEVEGPHADQAVGVGRGKFGAVGAEHDVGDVPHVTGEDHLLDSGVGVPQPDGAVVVPGGQCLTVRAEGDGRDWCGGGEGHDLVAGLGVPDVRPSLLRVGGGDALAVGSNTASFAKVLRVVTTSPRCQSQILVFLSVGSTKDANPQRVVAWSGRRPNESSAQAPLRVGLG